MVKETVFEETKEKEAKYLDPEYRKTNFNIDLFVLDRIDIINPYSIVIILFAICCLISPSTSIVAKLMILYAIGVGSIIYVESKLIRKIYISGKEQNNAHVYSQMAMPAMIGTILFSCVIIATLWYLTTVNYEFASFFESFNKWVFFIVLNAAYLNSQVVSLGQILLGKTLDESISYFTSFFFGIGLLANMLPAALVYINILILIAVLQYAIKKFSENYNSINRSKEEKLNIQRKLALYFMVIHSAIVAIFPYVYRLVITPETSMDNIFITIITVMNMLCLMNALYKFIVTWLFAPEKLLDYYQEDKSLEQLYIYKYLNGDFTTKEDCENAFSVALTNISGQG